MKNKKMMILISSLVIVALLSYLSVLNATSESQQTGNAIESTTLHDVLTPELATKKGIQGYITVKYLNLEKKNFELEKGGSITIELYLQYIAHNKDKQTTIIMIDPKSEAGLTIEKQLGKDGRTICLNDLVTYEPSGKILLTHGKITVIKMTIDTPSDIETLDIPIGPVGITAEVPIIHLGGGVKLNVQ